VDDGWGSCVLLAVDIEGFASPARDDRMRVLLRERLHELVDHALAAMGIAPGQVLACCDGGDAVLVMLDRSVSLARLQHPGISGLAQALARHNRTAASPAARLRLRMAVHQGRVIQDRHGFTGSAVIHVFRLVDAEVVRAALRNARTAGLIVIVSDLVYQALSKQDRSGGWQPVCLGNKETNTRGWIHLPGIRLQPSMGRLLAASDPLPAASSANEDDVVARQELLAFSGTLAGSASLEALVGQRRPSMMDARVAQRVAQRLHHADETIPVAHIHAGLARHAAAVDRLARCAGDRRVRAGLLGALALTQATRAFLAVYDRGDHRRATAYSRIAQQAAWELDDPVAMGLVCHRLSDAARLIAGHARLALEHARAGAHLVGGADLVLQAALQLAAAHAHEGLGQQTAALRALEAGQRLIEDPQFVASPWIRMDPTRFAGERGFTEAVCGRLEQAVVSLRTGIDALPADNGHRAVSLALLAKIRFDQQDPEQAAQLVRQALTVAQQLGSRGRLVAVSILDPYLRRYRTVPEVQELADQVRQARLPARSAARKGMLVWPHLGVLEVRSR
jgi:hypothetical protein